MEISFYKIVLAWNKLEPESILGQRASSAAKPRQQHKLLYAGLCFSQGFFFATDASNNLAYAYPFSAYTAE